MGYGKLRMMMMMMMMVVVVCKPVWPSGEAHRAGKQTDTGSQSASAHLSRLQNLCCLDPVLWSCPPLPPY